MEPVNSKSSISEKKTNASIIDTEEVRTINYDEYLGATQCLAEAFADDCTARYFFDTEDMEAYSAEYKWKLHTNIIKYIVAAHCMNGIVTTIGPNYEAVALWMPPGKNMDDWWTILRSGLWRLYYKLSREGKRRFYSEFLPLLHDAKHEVLAERDDKSYYLVYIGTKPGSRGKGYAKRLIDYGTSLADADGCATYLESTSGSNVLYYKKFGFEAKKDVHLIRAEHPITLNCLVREPRNSATMGSSSLKDDSKK